MNYRRLGRSGLKVSEVSLGNWLTQGRTVDQETTERLVKTAFDLGVNFFDTADVYHAGAGETALGHAIQGMTRRDLVIATKCYFPFSDKPNDRGLSKKHITESVHDSLKRLQTDYVDILQFHRFDPESPLDESVRAVDDLIRQGKVLYWGVSEWKADQIAEVVAVAKDLNAHLPISNQPSYSMLNRSIEDRVIPTCERMGLGQVVFSPLAQGILTGKYQPDQPAPEGSRGADDTSNMFMRGQLEDKERLQRVQDLKAWAESKGVTLAELALGWCLRQPNVASVIVGATRVEQVEANVKGADVKLNPEEWADAESVLGV